MIIFTSSLNSPRMVVFVLFNVKYYGQCFNKPVIIEWVEIKLISNTKKMEFECGEGVKGELLLTAQNCANEVHSKYSLCINGILIKGEERKTQVQKENHIRTTESMAIN